MVEVADSVKISTDELIEAGRQLYQRGWVPATSGNFSMRVGEDRIAITVSGRHKGALGAGDIMLVDAQGIPVDAKRPSAETLLHTQIYRRFPTVNAVLHTHSVNATLLSRVAEPEIVLRDYELLKAFPGVDTHEAHVTVPVFPNDQDIARLARAVDSYLDGHDDVHGYLIAGHGIYTWGESVADALRHLEAFEFLFQCELQLRGLAAR